MLKSLRSCLLLQQMGDEEVVDKELVDKPLFVKKNYLTPL